MTGNLAGFKIKPQECTNSISEGMCCDDKSSNFLVSSESKILNFIKKLDCWSQVIVRSRSALFFDSLGEEL
nr:tRNA-binding EMAP/Myf-like protein [Mucilaginibacter sp. SP1R1]